MTAHLKRPAFIWAVLLSILLMNGFMVAPSVGHARHHGDHQAGAHSTGICAWLCAAGQDVESVSVQLNPEVQPIEQVPIASVETLLPLASFYSRLRGPPSRYLSA